ncbi:hypothetical protein [Bartonella sp. AR 15-3]
MAQHVSSQGVMDDVLDHFHAATSTWHLVIGEAASRLFWALATISM